MNTGHAEAVKVVYEDDRTGLPFLLEQYYDIINPLSLNRQEMISVHSTGQNLLYRSEDEGIIIECSEPEKFERKLQLK